jgi:iron(III) transport system ATP-binding protein
MSDKRLEARGISRAFGGLKAVENVSLSIEAGQIVALLGRSGSGKSTLLRLFAGLEGLDAGEIWASGQLVSSPLFNVPPEQRGLGMVFQDYALFPHLTALGNVGFGVQRLGKTKARNISMEWLGRVGLTDRADYYPHQLSGGEQQRVALARALAPGPRAVLMDEPFSGLDPHLRVALQRNMLAALREAGVAALIVSHDTEEALGIADHVAIMDQGRIIQAGTPRDVYRQPVSLEAARALGPVWSVAAHAVGGKAQTPFGSFASAVEGPIMIGARPDNTHIRPSETGLYTVVDNRGVGRFVTTTLEGLQGFRDVMQARVEANQLLSVGTKVNVTVSPSDVFLFPASVPISSP